MVQYCWVIISRRSNPMNRRWISHTRWSDAWLISWIWRSVAAHLKMGRANRTNRIHLCNVCRLFIMIRRRPSVPTPIKHPPLFIKHGNQREKEWVSERESERKRKEISREYRWWGGGGGPGLQARGGGNKSNESTHRTDFPFRVFFSPRPIKLSEQ